jgi:glycosyltransferase involved in cell wall biosynthesis
MCAISCGRSPSWRGRPPGPSSCSSSATPELGAIRQLATELGIADRVLCVGRRPPATLRHYYSAGDVTVTTPWYEPYGLTPLEAMACGRPVIGAQVGGIAFTILDGETGFLVPPNDPTALAARLRCLLDRPALRGEFGAAARRRVEREFTWALTAARTAELLAGCAVSRPPGLEGRAGPLPAGARYLAESTTLDG